MEYFLFPMNVVKNEIQPLQEKVLIRSVQGQNLSELKNQNYTPLM